MTSSTKPDWDVIVIGTGMGGSAAGAISALNGLKTLILEKNPRIGGSCSYYEKEGFKIDMGSHLFICGNSGPFGDCTRRLGMGTPIEFLHTNPITYFSGMNIDMEFPAYGRMEILKSILELFKQMKLPLLEYPKIIKFYRDLLRIPRKEIEQLDGITFYEYLTQFSNNPTFLSMFGFIMDLYFILPTTMVSAGEAIWNFQKMAKTANLGYPKGGAVAIPETILKGAQNHGAKLELNCGVKKIEVSDGRVQGVLLENGERISAKAVISTSAVKDTILDLTGPEHFPEGYTEKVKKIKSAMIAVQGKIALKKRLTNAGSIVGGIKIPVERMKGDLLHATFDGVLKGKVPEFVPIYAPIPSNYDPDLAPPGCQLITTCALSPTTEIELKDEPSLWIDKMMDSMREILPDLDENIIFCDTFSVKSMASWIGKKSGAAITTAQTTDQAGKLRPPNVTPVKGLYIAGCGAGTIRGVGTELACNSGMECGDLVTRDFKNYLI